MKKGQPLCISVLVSREKGCAEGNMLFARLCGMTLLVQTYDSRPEFGTVLLDMAGLPEPEW